jgi:hypothetical protein
LLGLHRFLVVTESLTSSLNIFLELVPLQMAVTNVAIVFGPTVVRANDDDPLAQVWCARDSSASWEGLCNRKRHAHRRGCANVKAMLTRFFHHPVPWQLKNMTQQNKVMELLVAHADKLFPEDLLQQSSVSNEKQPAAPATTEESQLPATATHEGAMEAATAAAVEDTERAADLVDAAVQEIPDTIEPARAVYAVSAPDSERLGSDVLELSSDDEDGDTEGADAARGNEVYTPTIQHEIFGFGDGFDAFREEHEDDDLHPHDRKSIVALGGEAESAGYIDVTGMDDTQSAPIAIADGQQARAEWYQRLGRASSYDALSAPTGSMAGAGSSDMAGRSKQAFVDGRNKRLSRSFSGLHETLLVGPTSDAGSVTGGLDSRRGSSTSLGSMQSRHKKRISTAGVSHSMRVTSLVGNTPQEQMVPRHIVARARSDSLQRSTPPLAGSEHHSASGSSAASPTRLPPTAPTDDALAGGPRLAPPRYSLIRREGDGPAASVQARASAGTIDSASREAEPRGAKAEADADADADSSEPAAIYQRKRSTRSLNLSSLLNEESII